MCAAVGHDAEDPREQFDVNPGRYLPVVVIHLPGEQCLERVPRGELRTHGGARRRSDHEVCRSRHIEAVLLEAVQNADLPGDAGDTATSKNKCR